MYVLETQGNVISLKSTLLKLRSTTYGRKAAITTFSKSSRRRLIDLMARLDVRQVRTVFITLTYNGSPSAKHAKRDLRAFMKRMNRAYPACSAVWRMEYQVRGSIHFHLICFNVPYWKQHELQNVWIDVTKEALSIAHIKLVKSHSTMMKYVSKYVAKPLCDSADTSLVNSSYLSAPHADWQGRVWGYLNKPKLPFGKREACVLVDDEEAEYLAYIIEQVSHGYGKAKFSPYWKLFSPDARNLYSVAKARSGRIYEDWRKERVGYPMIAEQAKIDRLDRFFNYVN